MKKIININLSGRVIPIEDSAYEKLQSYIESLRRYFAKEEGRDEIINDIESRIAELMSDKVRKGANAIIDADIDEIISSMGRPEDFDAETGETATDAPKQGTRQEYSYTETKRKKRLYRDTNDKFIAGVCSGIANYMDTDPAIIRILFAIVTFGGFGLGFFIYILLWMFLPKSDLEHTYSGKRLYRNPDDRVISGVAGGLAAYFNTKVSTVRLIFAAPLLLSIFFSVINGLTWRTEMGHFFPNIVFGSLTGTFFLAYIILWIVLPEARTTYEKMEMRGEKVDVNSIRQNVQEGMGNVKDRMKQWSEEVKESAQNIGSKAKEFANTRGKDFAREVRETSRTGGRGIGHAIAVLFKVFFLFIAGTIAFGLFCAVMALIFGGVAWWPINDFLWTSKWQQAYAWGTIIFFLFVPLLGFLIWLIRRIIGIRSRRSYLGWTFGFLWTLGWISAILLAVSMSKDWSVYNNQTAVETIPISQPSNGKMILVVSEPELEFNGNFDWMDNEMNGWDINGDTGRLSTVNFRFMKSEDSAYHVQIRKSSRGRSFDEAGMRASKIIYHVSSKDSVLDLGNGYTIDKESKYRGQHVTVEVKVPVGKKIQFDRTVLEKLNPVDFGFRRRSHHRVVVNGEVVSDYYEHDGYFGFRTGVDYKMEANGKLTDSSGKEIYDNTDTYRFDNRDPEADTTVHETLEQREKRWKDEGEKIKEEKKKQKPTSYRQEIINAKSEVVAKGDTPPFSLTGSFF
jgi:phage shock protein PspC (stress-responsive transcriptional regulator)